jgi:hypothetical protein
MQQNVFPAPGSPAEGKRDILPGAGVVTAKRRADDTRRLRRVKDSREQLKSRTRARGTSNATIDTTTSNSTSAGRSYTVANVHNGVIYLRYASSWDYYGVGGRTSLPPVNTMSARGRSDAMRKEHVMSHLPPHTAPISHPPQFLTCRN